MYAAEHEVLSPRSYPKSRCHCPPTRSRAKSFSYEAERQDSALARDAAESRGKERRISGSTMKSCSENDGEMKRSIAVLSLHPGVLRNETSFAVQRRHRRSRARLRSEEPEIRLTYSRCRSQAGPGVSAIALA